MTITLRRSFPWIGYRTSKTAIPPKETAEPLREFVYLDEVSLASLLASQKGELTENITARSEDGLIAETAGKIGTNASLLPTAEVSSRFQTTNSSTLQTVRKATAQSLFRELHKLDYLRRIKPVEIDKPAMSVEDLFESPPDHALYKASDLHRGDLVEFRVKLSASWIFQMSTMVAEFSDMFDESPALFVEHVRFSDLYDAKNANKIVSRLLAGLVPIDGLVPEYSVIDHLGSEYIVHNSAIKGLDIEAKPLEVVGVTEHMAYWKDIRRILFSENEFTMLCRVSRSGLQSDWNPIKLADIFKDFSPDLASQIETSSRLAMMKTLNQSPEPAIDPNSMKLMTALLRYEEGLVRRIGRRITKKERREIDRIIAESKVNGNTAEDQTAAFHFVGSVVRSVTNEEIDATVDLAVREEVRAELGLSLFPIISKKREGHSSAEEVLEPAQSRLLDVEVVAIYW